MRPNKHIVSKRLQFSGRTRCGRLSTTGVMLLETLVALFIGLLTGAALLVLMQLTMTQRSTTMGPANSDAEARLQLANVSDSLRAAQAYGIDPNEVCFSAASASDLTSYSDTSGSTLRTWLNTAVSPAALEQTKTTGGVSTTTTLLTGVTALQFTYYKQAAASYNAPLSGWQTTASPTAPLTTELPLVGAVHIALTVTINGTSRQLNTLVRFRNSPYN